MRRVALVYVESCGHSFDKCCVSASAFSPQSLRALDDLVTSKRTFCAVCYSWGALDASMLNLQSK